MKEDRSHKHFNSVIEALFGKGIAVATVLSKKVLASGRAPSIVRRGVHSDTPPTNLLPEPFCARRPDGTSVRPPAHPANLTGQCSRSEHHKLFGSI